METEEETEEATEAETEGDGKGVLVPLALEQGMRDESSDGCESSYPVRSVPERDDGVGVYDPEFSLSEESSI
jgi:hypothetical protein